MMKAWLSQAVLACAAALILVSLAPLAARAWWVLELTTHFRLQYVAVGAVLLVLAAALRRPGWCTALAIAIAVSAAPLLDYIPPFRSAAAADSGARDLKIMTVNLSMSDFRPRAFLDIVAAESPDVLVLQEFSSVFDERLRELDSVYEHRIELPRRGPFGIALYSHYELTEHAELDLGGSPAVRTRVHAPAAEFTLIGVHLRAPSRPRLAAQRNRQLDLLAELRATIDGPLVIAGDFNITPFSPYFSELLTATGLRDPRAESGFSASWPTFLPLLGIPIDHCFVTDDFTVVDLRRLPAFGSDHYPVLAQLRLE
jgi:endonuclease/exonuclease/phosphatase (EEP) superfamily protein YafD